MSTWRIEILKTPKRSDSSTRSTRSITFWRPEQKSSTTTQGTSNVSLSVSSFSNTSVCLFVRCLLLSFFVLSNCRYSCRCSVRSAFCYKNKCHICGQRQQSLKNKKFNFQVKQCSERRKEEEKEFGRDRDRGQMQERQREGPRLKNSFHSC